MTENKMPEESREDPTYPGLQLCCLKANATGAGVGGVLFFNFKKEPKKIF